MYYLKYKQTTKPGVPSRYINLKGYISKKMDRITQDVQEAKAYKTLNGAKKCIRDHFSETGKNKTHTVSITVEEVKKDNRT